MTENECDGIVKKQTKNKKAHMHSIKVLGIVTSVEYMFYKSSLSLLCCPIAAMNIKPQPTSVF